MAPIPKNIHPVSVIFIVAITIGGLIVLAVLPFIVVALYLYISRTWASMVRNRKGYLKWNRERKTWNELAAEERRRRHIMSCVFDEKMDGKGVSLPENVRYWELIATLYSPARGHVPHILVGNFQDLWDQTQWYM
jgi:hypothetical protein